MTPLRSPAIHHNKTDTLAESKRHSPWISRVAITMIVVTGVSLIAWWQLQPSAQDLLKDAQKQLRRSRYELALTQAEKAIQQGSHSPSAFLIAGESATKLAQYPTALRHFASIDDSHADKSLAARLSAGSIRLHQHDLGHAEDELRRAVAIDPENVNAHRLLSETLGLQGRRWESLEHLRLGILKGQFDLQALCYLADTDRTVELSEEQVASFIQSQDSRCLLGAACVAISYRKFERGEELLRKCIDQNPELIEAHVRLGKQLLSRGGADELSGWDKALPETADSHPEVWFIRSQWCLREKSHQEAASCLRKALLINPYHAAANHQFAQALTVLERPGEAQFYGERGLKLTRLATLANEVYLGDIRSDKLREMAEIMESLERFSEAIGWTIAAQHEHPGEQWPIVFQRRLEAKQKLPLSETHASHLSDLDLTWTPPGSQQKSVRFEHKNRGAFVDVTEDVGLEFLYRNGEDPETEGRLMFEYTGGGTGVLDFDQDTWPDLYFTQAGDSKPFTEQTDHVDSLFRNRRGRFQDVASVAGINDFGFGQGVACGDINNDGFADLYVANIDGNQLYLNMGDGTFERATDRSGLGHALWTTSVAIADLNSDSIPDIYDVTFLGEDDVFSRVCEEDGVKRSCAPAGFQAADDFIYTGNGKGHFNDVSTSTGIRVPDGDGLGLLIADFSGKGTPDIFIANDGRANFFFQQDQSSETFMFRNQALQSGLALDRDGRAQACMGIASSDFDGDGRYDLFVTNFFNESNTLYSQYSNSVFGDYSQLAGIREPSLGMLAFGTQAVDVDLDGFDDLLIANGHVDNFEYKGIPYRMPIEYFHNNGGSGFKKIPADEAGSVFDRPMLGRSMATIDWNRDGQSEVAVSRLDDPALLLSNTTEDTGNYLVIRPVGMQSSRDASTVRFTAVIDNRELVRHLTAGDGYQSSNQKQVTLGLGDATTVEKLHIHWPNGSEQTLNDLDVNQSIVVIEGLNRAWTLPR